MPRFRRGTSDKDCPTKDPEILDQLEENGYLTLTPSRKIDNKLIVPYDDRFILTAAQHYNAIIVSNDNYRDLMDEKPEWKTIIHNNLLQYSFIGDLFMIADDPMGRKGPNIEQFLSIDSGVHNSNNNNFKKIQSSSVLNSRNELKNIPPLMGTINDSIDQIHLKKTEKERNNSISKKGGNERSSQETVELIKTLKDIFPNDENRIKQLVNSNLNCRNIEFFVNRLLK